MKKTDHFLTLSQDNSQYVFLPSGDIDTFLHKGFLINQFRGTPKDGSANNIYLRICHEEGIKAYPLTGIRSNSRVSLYGACLRQEGEAGRIRYQVDFIPKDSMWFWNITLNGDAAAVDLVYGQDLGMGEAKAVYTNELYLSQYLEHSVFEGKNGYIICSRQNMPNSGCFPYIQQGSLGIRTTHYSTDGLQFFGLSYKETNIPEALSKDLPDIKLQYEAAYTALETETFTLHGEKTCAFYGLFLENHADAIREAEYQTEIQEAYALLSRNISPTCYARTKNAIAPVCIRSEFGSPVSSAAFTPDEIDVLFPKRNLCEEKEGNLLSFFTPSHAHVVTKEKELLCERPHGTIVITPPDENNIDSALISSTHYMYGIFNSHVAIGNTDLHKLLSTPRGFLNLLKNSGQRTYIRLDGTYRLLTLPGLFEMGMNYSRCYYKLPIDTLIVTAYSAAHTPDLILEANSTNGQFYDFIVTSQLTMGPVGYDGDITCCKNTDGVCFTLNHSTVYPGLHYNLCIPNQNFTASDDRIFFEGDTAFDETLLTFSFENVPKLSILMRGYLSADEDVRPKCYVFETERDACFMHYQNLNRHFHLDAPNSRERAAILNETAWWYTHNAMIHYSMPHGLEQPGGAAWDTRDICQGPFEFFLATQHTALARKVLLNIFAHQDIHTREWPQWFMFDRYRMNAGECHGDVIFWPLKCVADYLNATGDYHILKEEIPYENAGNKAEALIDHNRLAHTNITETRLIGDTGLITYAGGDWDDTLQPASNQLKEHLVSAWTQALAYQTFTSLAGAIAPVSETLAAELFRLAALVKKAFSHYLIKDGTIAGFLKMDHLPGLLLHPSDNTTGIRCRLLPITRSIIAGLVSLEQAEKNVKTIQSVLKCPDGVRLMDHPASYDGGVSRLFRRAEQAANVGREVSLQYTHAHIRYIEAMAQLGKGQEAWEWLFTINPVLIHQHVKNAGIRQSNLYFSSSDGAYNDRYDYADNGQRLSSSPVHNPYRQGSILLTHRILAECSGTIDIHFAAS